MSASIVERLRELSAGAAKAWKVVPVDGKPTIASSASGNLFRGYIATWREADLAVELVNNLPEIIAALAKVNGQSTLPTEQEPS